MGWVITTAAIGSGTRTTYTLTVPGLDLGSIETLNKELSADIFAVGDIVGVSKRTSAGELWKSGSGFLHSSVAGAQVTTASGSGVPTFQAKRIKTYTIGSECGVGDVSIVGSSRAQTAITSTVSASSGAESWVSGQVIYAYNNGSGILYTKTKAVANAATVNSYILGRAFVLDPQISGNWIVAVLYYESESTSSGINAKPNYPLPAGAGLGDIIYSDAARSAFTTTQSFTLPSYVGAVNAISGTGAGALMSASSVSSELIGNADAALGLSAPVKELSFYHGTPALGFGSLAHSFTWNTAKFVSLPSISFDELRVVLPILGARQSIGAVSDCLDFAIDVTLPAPVGACRLVYTQGIPAICKRTSDTVAPYVGAVANLNGRPQASASFNESQTTGTGVKFSFSDAIPYPLRPFVSANQGTQPTYGAVSWETLPTGASNFTVYASSGTAITSAEASWAYYDCVSATYINTGVTSLGIASSSSDYELSGAVSAPILPSGYLVGSWVVQYRYFAGSWSAWTVGGRVYGTTQVGLPCYPFAVQAPPWLVADSDCTPVSFVGWVQTAKTQIGTPSWGGSPSASWDGIRININLTGVTPTLAATAMYGAPITNGARGEVQCSFDAPGSIGPFYNTTGTFWNNAQSTVGQLGFLNQRPSGSTSTRLQLAEFVPVPHAAHAVISATLNIWPANTFNNAFANYTCVVAKLSFVDLVIP